MAWAWARTAVRSETAGERVAEAAVTSRGFDTAGLERLGSGLPSEDAPASTEDRLPDAAQDSNQSFKAAGDVPNPELLVPMSLEARMRAVAMCRMAASFGDIVGLMMRSPQYMSLSLADLEWFVLPALRLEQCLIMEQTDRATGMVGPLAAVLWAQVSQEIEARLHAQVAMGQLPHLTAQEWNTGTRLWLVAAAGEKSAIAFLISEAGKKTKEHSSRSMDNVEAIV